MKCPACLLFATDTDATTTVNGTQLCDQHGQEALLRGEDPRSFRGNGPARRSPWSAPGTPVVQGP